MLNRVYLLALAALPLACTSPAERARADSAQALVLTQRHLMQTLVAQRDSVSRILTEADAFVGQIDSSISRVKSLPRSTSADRTFESAIDEQLHARKDMLRRVNALVARAKKTAAELSAAKKREQALLAENGKLRAQVDSEAAKIAELTATISQQALAIATLQARIDGMSQELTTIQAATSRAYYVVGTEGDLLKKGVVVREGGANLLVVRVGRTLVPARTLKKEMFTAIDTREMHNIVMPDSSKRYQIVSRQSLDDAQVANREGASFRGPLKITDADKFWGPSRYLILVQR
jgi:hypothetical protein